MQTKTILALLAQRPDGAFLCLEESQHTTSYSFSLDPLKATRLVRNEYNAKDPIWEPAYYFENSDRARRLWLPDCKMVLYKFTETVDCGAVE
jgi:hypothetical protein